MTTSAFDARNRLLSVTGPDPDGEGPQSAPTTRFAYDPAGNQTSVTDPLGRTTVSAFDAQNRLLSQTLPDPDGAGPLTAPQTQYAYTRDGQLASITDPVGNTTCYVYDDAGRLIEVGDPIVYQHDAAGQVVGITDRNGRQRTFTYNDLGAKTSETWLDQSNNPVRVISWTYDDAGRMISASDPDSSYSFTYDLVGNVTGVDNLGTPNMPRVALTYTYDYAGNRTSLIDNLGGQIDYTYANHRLANMTWTVDASQLAQLDFAYDTVGRPTTVTRSGGANGPIVTAYQYDDGDRLTSITHTLDPQGTPTVLSQFSYTFDLANQITSYTGPEGTLNYEYDQTGQLIGVSGARTENYAFDENGNRTMEGYVTGDFNRLLSDGTYNYEYDLEGNMLTKTKISDGEKTTFTWDHRNRLTHIVVTNAAEDIIKEAVYTYDVFDRRIGIWEDADGSGAGVPTERWTVYDGANPYADFNAQGSLTSRYLYGQAMDQLFARMDNGGGLDWYLTDILGSVRQIAAAHGTVLDNIDYSSFGQVLNESNPENGDRFKFTARELDALFGQYQYRARYYGPDIGRFTQEDRLSFAAGDTNLYRYVENMPSNATDPSGMDIVLLFDPNALGRVGHPAVLIGNDRDGWTYFSFHAGDPSTTVDNLERFPFTTLAQARADRRLAHFRQYIHYRTTPAQDANARREALRWANQGYDLATNNCALMAHWVARRAGLDLPTYRVALTPSRWWSQLWQDARNNPLVIGTGVWQPEIPAHAIRPEGTNAHDEFDVPPSLPMPPRTRHWWNPFSW